MIFLRRVNMNWQMSDYNVDFSDLYADLLNINVDISDHYVNLSKKIILFSWRVNDLTAI